MVDKTKIYNILFITLSNIGDVVLTLPVLGVLEREFPLAKITVMVSPYAKEIFQNDPAVTKIITYDKRINFLEKINLGLRLRKKKFDLVVDLRSTLFPMLIGPAYRTSLSKKPAKEITHKKFEHLNKLASLEINTDGASYNLCFSEDDKNVAKDLFLELGISSVDKIVAVAPGAKSHTKRWMVSGFAKVCQRLTKELGVKVLFIGDAQDKEIISQILSSGLNDVHDISGRTNISQLAYILSCCKLLITNDSAPMHLADIVNTPSIAVFGPTDYRKYGPRAKNSHVIRKQLKCAPCEKAQCVFNFECMKQVDADEVFETAKRILNNGV